MRHLFLQRLIIIIFCVVIATQPLFQVLAHEVPTNVTAEGETAVSEILSDKDLLETAALAEPLSGVDIEGGISTNSPGIEPLTETEQVPIDPINKRDNSGLKPEQNVGSYNVDEFNGAFNYSYPIEIPQGRNKLQPNLALNYNHQRSNLGSFIGYGWDLPLPSIERQAKTGVNNLYLDNYFKLNLVGSQDLVSISVDSSGYGTYGKQIEDTFEKIEYSNSGWIVTDTLGMQYTFGSTTSSRQDDPTDPAKIYKWLLTEVRDTNDNFVTYEYFKDSGQIYPKKIIYTGHGQVGGIYEIRFQPFAAGNPTENNLSSISYTTGFKVQTKYLLSSIEIWSQNEKVRSYDLTLINNGLNTKKLLTGIQPKSYQGGQEFIKDAASFSYTADSPIFSAPSTSYQLPNGYKLGENTSLTQSKRDMFLDLDQDGLADYLRISCQSGSVTLDYFKNNGTGGWTNASTYDLALGGGYTCNFRTLIPIAFGEVNGDRRIDVITQNNYYINTESGWQQQTHSGLPVSLSSTVFAGSSPHDAVSFIDMNSDGYDDIVYVDNENTVAIDSTATVYMRIPGAGWQLDSDYTTAADLVASDCLIYGGDPFGFADLNNDGLTDIFYSYYCHFGSVFGNENKVFLNTGSGVVYAPSFTAPRIMSEFYGNGDPIQKVPFISDYNEDGVYDIGDFTRSKWTTVTNHHYSANVVINNQTVFDFPDQVGQGYFEATMPVAIADFNGDSRQDVMHSYSTIFNDVYFQSGIKPDVMSAMSYQDGSGLQMEYGYSTQERDAYNNKLNPSLPFNLQVVKKVTNLTGLNDNRESNYSYSGGRSASFNQDKIRDIYGFSKVRIITGKSGSTGTDTVIRESEYGLATSSANLNDSYFLHGRKLRDEFLNSNNYVERQTVQNWQQQLLGINRRFVAPVEEISTDIHLLEEGPLQEYTPDAHTLALYHMDGTFGSSEKANNAQGNTSYDLEWAGPFISGVGFNGENEGSFSNTLQNQSRWLNTHLTSLGSGPFTIELWNKHLGSTLDNKLFGKINEDSNGFYAEFDPNQQRMIWESGADTYSWSVATAPGSVQNNVWHHYAFVMDGTTAKIYIDGDLRGQGSVTYYGASFVAQPLIFYCTRTSPCSNAATYTIDEVRISDSARSAQEIYDYYHNTQEPYFETSLAKRYTYDNTNGNILTEVNLGNVTAEIVGGTITDELLGDEKTTTYNYAQNTEKYILSAAKTKTVMGFSTTKDQDLYYDQLPFGQVDKVNLTKEDLKVNTVDIETTFNNYGLPLTKKDPKDNTAITLSYDAANMYVTTSTDALGRQTITKHDPRSGQLLYSRDPNGYQERFTYDAFNRLTRKEISDPANVNNLIIKQELIYTDGLAPRSVESHDYFASGRYTRHKEYYDGLGRVVLTKQSTAAANQFITVAQEYDAQGRVKRQSLPYITASINYEAGQFTNSKNYTYDAQDRVLTETTPTGVTSYSYDGLVTTITDPRGKMKKLTNDAHGNLVKVEEFNNGQTYTTNYEYTLTNKLKKITDAQGNIRTFTYDALDNLTQQDMVHKPSVSNPVKWTYTYDKNGNVLSKLDPKSQTVNYTYDSLNRLTQENFTGKTGIEYVLTYDQGSGQLGRLTQAVSSDGVTITYTYDQSGRPLTVSRTIDGQTFVLTFTYDWSGNVTSIVYPEGERVDYIYNDAAQIAQVNKVKNNQTTILAQNVSYSPLGQVAHLERGNGVITDYTYDASQSYRLTRLRSVKGGTVLQDISYTYDPNGNILTLTDTSVTALAKNVVYTYDDLNRLASVTVTNSASGTNYSHSYTYDSIGNILTSDIGSYTYTLNNPHQARIAGSTTLTYDTNGNVRYVNSNPMIYDYRDRLSSSSHASSPDHTEYVYDHTNQRIKKHTIVYVAPPGGGDCENHPDDCPDPIQGIPRVLPPQPAPGKLPTPVLGTDPVAGSSQENEVLSTNTQVLNNTKVQIENTETKSNLEISPDSEVSIQTINNTDELIVEPIEILPTPIITDEAINPEPVASSTDSSIVPVPALVEPVVTTDDLATTTDPTALSVEPPIEIEGAPSAQDTATYYVDKYYEKQWNGSSRNHYFLGNIKLGYEILNGTGIGIYYNLPDHLGSSVLVTNSTGTITELSDYYPYGKIAYEAVPTNTNNNYHYTGKELDAETDLSYFGARYYAQNIGRFMAMDPYSFKLDKLSQLLTDPQSLNSYTYTRNNPIILIDPDGNTFLDSVAHFFGGAGNAFISNNAFGLGRMDNPDPSYRAGQKFGDGLSLVQGAFETAFGVVTTATGAAGGIALSPTGVGAIAGGAISAEGLVITGHGASVFLYSSNNLIKNGDKVNDTSPSLVPDKASNVLKQIEDNSFRSAPKGYKGGSIFNNKEGLLPTQQRGYYKEWDINPTIKGVDRSPERLITGKAGEAWYTPDHYKTFIEIR